MSVSFVSIITWSRVIALALSKASLGAFCSRVFGGLHNKCVFALLVGQSACAARARACGYYAYGVCVVVGGALAPGPYLLLSLRLVAGVVTTGGYRMRE